MILVGCSYARSIHSPIEEFVGPAESDRANASLIKIASGSSLRLPPNFSCFCKRSNRSIKLLRSLRHRTFNQAQRLYLSQWYDSLRASSPTSRPYRSANVPTSLA